MAENECLLCMINKGKIPANKIYEDEEVLAILDVNGANPGHSFIFPKQHYPILEQVPDAISKKLFLLSNKVSSALFDTLDIQGTNVFIQNGVAAGQVVAHYMIQVIPRAEKDDINLTWEPRKLSEEEMSTVELKLKEETKNLLVSGTGSQPKEKTKTGQKPGSISDEEDFRLKQVFRRVPR